MSNPPQPKSKQLKWRLECALYSVLEIAAAMLPGSCVFRIGEWMGAMAWHMMRRRRQIIVRNLRIAYAGEKSIDEIQVLAKAAMRRASANLISAAHSARLSPARLNEVLEIENHCLLQRSIDAGRGVVLLLAHMGNWELLSRLTLVFPPGVKVGGMYRPLNNIYMDERVNRRRQADGARMFSKRDPFHQITGFLRDGGIVGVLADQRVGVNGDTIRFFGRLTKASPLPSLLARRSKSDVLALSLSTTRPGKWKATLSEVETPPSTGNCMAALEAAMRQSPEDVFWLQERWKLRLGHGFYIRDLYDEQTGDPDKRHRALLWLAGVDDFSGLAPLWIHPDVNYELVLTKGRPVPANLPQCVRMHEIAPQCSLEYELGRIDQLDALPVDFVLTTKLTQLLAKACNRQGIPLYAHEQISVPPPKSAKRPGHAQEQDDD